MALYGVRRVYRGVDDAPGEETRGGRESARMAGEKKGFFARTARERGGTRAGARARALGATSH